MNKKINFKIICFIIIFIILLHISDRILVPKWTKGEDNRITQIIKGFYEEPKNSLDVVFMGNSDVYRGISPICLWDEYGIASYNYVSSGQRMWTAYYLMEECIKYQKPKLIVLNMDAAFNETKSTESNYRKAFDNMRLGINKIKAITDKVFKNKLIDKISYIFPTLRFHSRWNQLNEEDFTEAFKKYSFSYKGMDITTKVEPYNDEYKYMENDHSKEKIGKKCTKYINKMIELCRKNDIELLLIELPSAESWSEDLSNKTFEFAKENNLEFIDLNLNAEEFGFDWKTDSSDGGDHLNIYGATKVSKYLGKIIKEKYDIPDRRNDEEYKEWYNDSKIYHEDIQKMEEENK